MKDKILVYHLDDDQQTLAKLRVEFEKIKTAQIMVKSFRTPEGLFAAMKKGPAPNLAIIDIELNSGLDGFDVTATLRNEHPELVIFMYSHYVTKEVYERAQNAGADDCLPKNSPAHWQADHVVQVYMEGLIEKILGHKKQQKIKRGNIKIIGHQARKIDQRIGAILSSELSPGILVTGERGTGKSFIADLVRASIPSLLPKILIRRPVEDLTTSGDLEAVEGGWLLIDPIEVLTKKQQEEIFDYIDRVPAKRRFKIFATSGYSRELLRNSPTHDIEFMRYISATSIRLQSLKDRRSEIPEFLDHVLSKTKGGPFNILPGIRQLLHEYDYADGNLWELEEIVSEMTAFLTGGLVTASSLPEKIKAFKKAQKVAPASIESSGTELRLAYDREKINFKELTDTLLLALIDSLRVTDPDLSLRSVSQRIGMSRAALTARISKLVASGRVSPDFLSEGGEHKTED